MTPSTRQYQVRAVQFDPAHVEEYRVYEATSLSEALSMAERADAGQSAYTYGILPEDYAIATGEGIDFNEADGLLL